MVIYTVRQPLEGKTCFITCVFMPFMGTYKVRNEINENEIDWYEENGRKKIRQNEIKK